uniref:purine-nucleoside phosphorylase n=1 Tax=Cyprinus carpio TaxID=7962 RepID=A0A8C1PUV2_CYPCA
MCLIRYRLRLSKWRDSKMHGIWVGVCTPGNEPHMLPILWQNSSLTHWQISYCILALYTLCDLQFSIKLLLKSKNTDHLKFFTKALDVENGLTVTRICACVSQVTFPVRVFKLLGVETLMVTNAAGSLADSYSCGDIMIICDHINFPGLAGLNPLNGPNDDKFGPRFPPMSGVYDKSLRKMAFDICKNMGVSQYVQEGVYCMVGGPNFESIAEARFLHRLGVDAVGMSTAPEVLVASHCGMRVFGLSLITNKVVKSYEDNESVNHEAVLEVSKMRSEMLQTLVTELISRMDINNNTA